MPAVFNSLASFRGLSDHVAWRVAFIVPFILITAVAIAMLLLCEDTPTGKWSERHLIIEGESGSPPPEPLFTEEVVKALKSDGSLSKEPSAPQEKKKPSKLESPLPENEPFKIESAAPDQNADVMTTALGEMVVNPTLREALSVIFSLQSLALAAPYACSFGEIPQFHFPFLSSLVRVSCNLTKW
jgi:MFS transporter, NNP family, nitrate/nitrite transporter